ncbi:MAG: hypothetical protein RLZZ480_340 [Candidatus Parcubacteria bacterium]|jgi:carbamoyl-phosphate synthase large subunit
MDSNKKLTILVTGVGGPAGINISRLFQKRDDVFVIGCDVDATATGQCFVDEFVIAPFVHDAAAYETWMKKIVTERTIDMVVPTVHEELPLLATFVAELPAYVPLASKEVLALGEDKLTAYQYLEEHLPASAPRFVLLRDFSKEWAGGGETLFIKPRVGRGGRGCRRVTLSEILELKEKGEDLENIIVMENLPGMEWTIDVFMVKCKEIVYLVPRERLGLAGGIAIKGRTVRHAAVIEATKAFLSKLDVEGPVCIQWKADASGQPKFVEINPRLSGGLMISVAGGIDPAGALVALARGKRPAEQNWQEVMVAGYLDYRILK